MKVLPVTELLWGFNTTPPPLPPPVGRGRWLTFTSNLFIPLPNGTKPPPRDRRTPDPFAAKLANKVEPNPFQARLVETSLTPAPYGAKLWHWPALTPVPSPTPTPPTPTPTSSSSFSFIYW